VSTDTVDDLHAAEDAAGLLADRLRALVDVVEGADTTDAYGNAMDNALAALEFWANYCRPGCQFRAEGQCQDDPECCGCPCDHQSQG
jgi:hypothetical protein